MDAMRVRVVAAGQQTLHRGQCMYLVSATCTKFEDPLRNLDPTHAISGAVTPEHPQCLVGPMLPSRLPTADAKPYLPSSRVAQRIGSSRSCSSPPANLWARAVQVQANHRSWADFFIDAYLTEGRAMPLSRCEGAARWAQHEEEALLHQLHQTLPSLTVVRPTVLPGVQPGQMPVQRFNGCRTGQPYYVVGEFAHSRLT